MEPSTQGDCYSYPYEYVMIISQYSLNHYDKRESTHAGRRQGFPEQVWERNRIE